TVKSPLGVGLEDLQVPNITENVTVEITIEPEFPVVGVTVVLRPKDTPENIISCAWGRGEEVTYKDILIYEVSPAPQLHKKAGYNTRHTPGKDCSLSIKNISKSDMDIYVLQRNASNSTAVGKIYLLVIKGKHFFFPLLDFDTCTQYKPSGKPWQPQKQFSKASDSEKEAGNNACK
uniref:Uncharacterized protein n=1 Tax=Pseudonaja textilis TaxID=8673 RepID=A0A670ZY57_PSETE